MTLNWQGLLTIFTIRNTIELLENTALEIMMDLNFCKLKCSQLDMMVNL
jgi:aspartate carbamoyltransferase catalytic subunit